MTHHVLDNEKQLLEQIALGSESAFRELVGFYSNLLATHLFRFTKSREQAEEIVQDIFLQVWISRETLPHIRSFRGYLFVISRNHALNAVRSMIRQEQRLKKWQQDNQQEWITPPLPDDNVVLQVGLIEEAIAQLPQQQQRVWLLSRKEGLKHREIAEKMGLSQETVKKYIQYANAALLEYIEPRIKLALAGAILFSFS